MTIKELTEILLFWISINTNYDTSKFDYKINEVSKDQLQNIACKGRCPILAIFLPDKGIYYAKTDLKNACSQSVILHEMIHGFQEIFDRRKEDIFREQEAYELQNKFLKDYSNKNELIYDLSVKKCRSLQTKIWKY